MKKILPIWLIPFALLLTACGSSEYNKIHECDTLAADPLDNRRIEGVAGVKYENIQSRLAVTACSEAIKNYPKTTRFYYQLGRAYLASEEASLAVAPLSIAMEKEYPAAFFGMADTYTQLLSEIEENIPDLQKALLMLEAASNAGYPVDDEQKITVARKLFSVWFTDDGYQDNDVIANIYNKGIDEKSIEKNLYEILFDHWATYSDYCTPGSHRFNEIGMSEAEFTAKSEFYLLFLNGALQSQGEEAIGYFFANKLNAIMQNTMKQIEEGENAEFGNKDVLLFIGRHGCDTPVSKRYFENLVKYIDVAANPIENHSGYREYRNFVVGIENFNDSFSKGLQQLFGQ